MCVTVHTLNGQEFEHVFKSYDVDDGMPSSQTFKIIQDKQGYIWFGSNRGLVKYNGYEFKKYTVKDGLSVNLIYHVCADEDNTVYFIGSDYKVFYIKNDQIYEFQGNDEIIDIDARAQILSLVTDEEYLHISFWNKLGNPSYFKFKKDGALVERKTLDAGIEIIEVDGKPIIHCGGENSALTITYGKLDSIINVIPDPTNLAYTAQGKNKIYFSIRKDLYVIENNGFRFLKTFDNTIFNLAVDQNDNLYVAFHKDGLFKYEKGNLNKATHLLSNQNSISILIDVNNNLWCGSGHRGLQFSTLRNFTHLKLKDKVQSLDLFGDEKQLLAVIDKEKIYNVSDKGIFEVNQNQKFYTSKIKKEHLYKYYSSSVGGDKLLNFKNQRFDYNNFPLGSYYIDHEILNDTNLWVIGRDLIVFVNESGEYEKVYYVPFRFDCFKHIEDQVFLLGTTNGMKVTDLSISTPFYGNIEYFGRTYNAVVEPYYINHPFFNSSISDIVVEGNTRIFTSVEQGLWIEKDSISTWLTEENGIISDNLEKILFQDGYIIVSSNSGVSVLDENYTIRNYNSSNGLITNDVDGFYLRNDSLWVASKMGISLLSLKQNVAKPSDHIPLILKKISINDKEWKLDSILTLRHIYGRVEVEFEALNYIKEGDINYRYKLKGLEENWNYTTNRNIRYTNLPAGKFKLLISHELENEKWAEPIVLLTFKKRIPIMIHWVFIIIYILLIIWLFIKLSNFLNRRQSIKQQNALTILELERKALQAQMNPHFMFNSLSSLKYMIMKDKKRDSEDYLTKFSKFTRLTLNHSTEKFIPIEDEIELLNNYIDLELTRFENKFEYTITNHVSGKNVKIPPMLIQPFIENSIIHAFDGLEKLGVLTIVFEDNTANTILCTITDNGVGRAASVSHKRHKKSFGMSLVLKRLKLLHKEGDISIIDLQNENEKLGTKIEVKIPFVRKTE